MAIFWCNRVLVLNFLPTGYSPGYWSLNSHDQANTTASSGPLRWLVEQQRGLVPSQNSTLSQNLWMELKSGLCAGQNLSLSTPSLVNHVFINYSLYTTAMLCWNVLWPLSGDSMIPRFPSLTATGAESLVTYLTLYLWWRQQPLLKLHILPSFP